MSGRVFLSVSDLLDAVCEFVKDKTREDFDLNKIEVYVGRGAYTFKIADEAAEAQQKIKEYEAKIKGLKEQFGWDQDATDQESKKRSASRLDESQSAPDTEMQAISRRRVQSSSSTMRSSLAANQTQANDEDSDEHLRERDRLYRWIRSGGVLGSVASAAEKNGTK